MKIRYLLTSTILCFLMSTSVFADEISDQIAIGLEAYTEQDYKTAIEELKFVTAQIQQLNQEELQKLLPQPLDGWTEKEGNNQANMGMMGGGTNLQKEFHRDREKVTVSVMANSPMMQMMTMMLKTSSDDGRSKKYKTLSL